MWPPSFGASTVTWVMMMSLKHPSCSIHPASLLWDVTCDTDSRQVKKSALLSVSLVNKRAVKAFWSTASRGDNQYSIHSRVSSSSIISHAVVLAHRKNKKLQANNLSLWLKLSSGESDGLLLSHLPFNQWRSVRENNSARRAGLGGCQSSVHRHENIYHLHQKCRRNVNEIEGEGHKKRNIVTFVRVPNLPEGLIREIDPVGGPDQHIY